MKIPLRLLAIPAFLVITAHAGSVLAGPFKKSPAKLDVKIRRAAERLIALQAEPKKRIPAPLLANARGIIIIHKVKAGLGIGGEAGGGVALVKNKQTGKWSAPAFVASAEASYGLQIGAQESDIVLVLMGEEGLKPLLGGSLEIGVDVQAVAGPADAGGDFDTTTLKAPILAYSNSGGLFAGAAFKGGGIVPAKKNNLVYYNAEMSRVLFEGTVKPTPSGQYLIDVIRTYSGEKVR